jgi:hypothetical protein
MALHLFNFCLSNSVQSVRIERLDFRYSRVSGAVNIRLRNMSGVGLAISYRKLDITSIPALYLNVILPHYAIKLGQVMF